LRFEGAAYTLPEGPGLGIEIDEQAVLSVAARPVLQRVSGQ
jgi:L-alanine-DL-glutamate epimerase-like enolase superfamily enzyme